MDRRRKSGWHGSLRDLTQRRENIVDMRERTFEVIAIVESVGDLKGDAPPVRVTGDSHLEAIDGARIGHFPLQEIGEVRWYFRVFHDGKMPEHMACDKCRIPAIVDLIGVIPALRHRGS